MVSRELLAQISSVLSAAKQQSGQPADSRPFGGINVIIIGDFHQFPPVACGPTAPLYWPPDLNRGKGNPQDVNRQKKRKQAKEDSPEAIVGGEIYRKFRTVVLLQEQCRTTDETWRTVLQHARTGTCTPKHLAIIRGLIMASDTVGCGGASVDDPAWQDAVLVTPRHGVRMAWNQMATRRHCAKNQTQLFICPAEDKIGGRPLTVSERYWAAKKLGKKKGDRSARKERGNLPDVVELAVGMEVMVTYNVETELDVANGARGVIQEIILDRREIIPDGLAQSPREVTLAYPPECVLVKLARTKARVLPGLEQGVVPIIPMERGYDVSQQDGKRKRVSRRQLPMTAAYAFTDYRAQGQTIRRVIVDIARPPSGELTPFNAYVALSRSSGRSTIRLLRDFDDRLFTKNPCEKLKDEDARLKELNLETKRRWELGETVWDNLDEGTHTVNS